MKYWMPTCRSITRTSACDGSFARISAHGSQVSMKSGCSGAIARLAVIPGELRRETAAHEAAMLVLEHDLRHLVDLSRKLRPGGVQRTGELREERAAVAIVGVGQGALRSIGVL